MFTWRGTISERDGIEIENKGRESRRWRKIHQWENFEYNIKYYILLYLTTYQTNILATLYYYYNISSNTLRWIEDFTDSWDLVHVNWSHLAIMSYCYIEIALIIYPRTHNQLDNVVYLLRLSRLRVYYNYNIVAIILL